MHPFKYISAILLFTFLFASPLPAIAQAPDIRPIAKPGIPSPSSRTKVYSFYQVWTLITNYQRAHPSHFSPELVTCLMWEESGFRLVENPQSHALGFGQVLPATLTALNRRYKTNLTRTQPLTLPDASVQATMLALELAYEWKKTKVAALLAYAGGFQNYRPVQKWIAAEPGMIEARWSEASASSDLRANASAQLIRAMRICSQPGFDPQRVF